jgi:alkyl hydroperoxide reductase subunit AhpC
MNGKNLKLDSGLQQLEEWAEDARQTQKNQVYKALFAITDGSVASSYGVLADKEDPNAHFVLVREDLVIKVNYPDRDTFGISYIGPLADAPGIHLAFQAL